MVTPYTFKDRLDFSTGRKRATDMETIKVLLPGCVSVKITGREQERKGIDYIATLRGGAEIYIDSKAREKGCSLYWKNGQPEVALEIWSVKPSLNSPGVTGWTLNENKLTDMILFTYDITDTDLCYLVPFQHLRIAFRKYYALWTHYKKAEQETDGNYRSECVFVPIDTVLNGIVTTCKGLLSKDQGV